MEFIVANPVKEPSSSLCSSGIGRLKRLNGKIFKSSWRSEFIMRVRRNKRRTLLNWLWRAVSGNEWQRQGSETKRNKELQAIKCALSKEKRLIFVDIYSPVLVGHLSWPPLSWASGVCRTFYLSSLFTGAMLVSLCDCWRFGWWPLHALRQCNKRGEIK